MIVDLLWKFVFDQQKVVPLDIVLRFYVFCFGFEDARLRGGNLFFAGFDGCFRVLDVGRSEF